jgi:hypothetical protein
MMREKIVQEIRALLESLAIRQGVRLHARSL